MKKLLASMLAVLMLLVAVPQMCSSIEKLTSSVRYTSAEFNHAN